MRSIIGALCLPAVLSVTGVAAAGQDVTLDQLPPAVRATLEKETKGGSIKDIEKDREAGKDIYEVEFTMDGHDWELDIAADGKLLEKRLD